MLHMRFPSRLRSLVGTRRDLFAVVRLFLFHLLVVGNVARVGHGISRQVVKLHPAPKAMLGR